MPRGTGVGTPWGIFREPGSAMGNLPGAPGRLGGSSESPGAPWQTRREVMESSVEAGGKPCDAFLGEPAGNHVERPPRIHVARESPKVNFLLDTGALSAPLELHRKYIQQKQQQKQQRQQHKNLLWQFIQQNIRMSRDVMGYMIHNITVAPPGL